MNNTSDLQDDVSVNDDGKQADIDTIAELVECLRLVLLEHRTFFVIPEKLHDRITAAVTAWEGK